MSTSLKLNQFLQYVDENVLECALCLKRLQKPKSLNCLHSFCLACLEDWVKTKGKLTCPICLKSYAIPEGGLQDLPPNTFLNNLFEAIEQIAKRGQKNCVCGKQQAAYYCQECRHYLCKTCSDCHRVFPALASHKLHTVEGVESMTPQDFALLHPPLCSLHNKSLEFYCTDCTTPICINCTLMEHKVWEGKHKAISISQAFQTFKESSTKLEETAQNCKKKLEDDLQTVSCNATTFEQSKNSCLSDIDNHVQTLIKTIEENGDKMKKKVEEMYEIYTATSNAHMDELRTIISDINTKLSFLNQLLKSNEATAMQSSEKVITALKDRIKELPKTKPSDSEKINFSINAQQIASLENDIGIVTQTKLHNSMCYSMEDEEDETYSPFLVGEEEEKEDEEEEEQQQQAQEEETNSKKYIYKEKNEHFTTKIPQSDVFLNKGFSAYSKSIRFRPYGDSVPSSGARDLLTRDPTCPKERSEPKRQPGLGQGHNYSRLSGFKEPGTPSFIKGNSHSVGGRSPTRFIVGESNIPRDGQRRKPSRLPSTHTDPKRHCLSF